MKTETLTVQEALDRGRALPWALVRSLSEVTLGRTPAVIDREELIEARFFSPGEEIRVFRANGVWTAARLEGEPEDSRITRTYGIGNPKFGTALTVCYTLEADEDGQTSLAAARLTGWEGSR